MKLIKTIALTIWLSLFISCSSNKICEMEMLDAGSPGWGAKDILCQVYKNGTYIQSDGQTGLWRFYDIANLKSSILSLKKDFNRSVTQNRTNIVDVGFAYEHFNRFNFHNMNNLYWTTKSNLHLVRKPEKDSPLFKKLHRLSREYTHGDFEFVCNKDTYGDFLRDSIGLFNAPEKKYGYMRRINGITGHKLSLLKTGNIYDFHFRMDVPGISESGDTMPLLWCRAYLPAGIHKLAMPTQNDLVFDYGDNQFLWIHLNLNGTCRDIQRAKCMTESEARQFIDSHFPADYDKNLMDLAVVKRHMESSVGKSPIRMRTNRCTVISSEFKKANAPLLETMLYKTFVEDDIQLMEIIRNITKDGVAEMDRKLDPPLGCDVESDEFKRSVDSFIFLFPFSLKNQQAPPKSIL